MVRAQDRAPGGSSSASRKDLQEKGCFWLVWGGEEGGEESSWRKWEDRDVEQKALSLLVREPGEEKVMGQLGRRSREG